MKKIRFTVFLVSIIVLAVSCKNPFYEKLEQEITEKGAPKLCVLTAETDGSTGRSAFPSSLGNLKYYASIKTPDGKYLTDNASSPVSTSMVFLANKGTGNSVRFLFFPYAQAGTYEITVYAFPEGITPSPNTSKHYKAKAVVKKNLSAGTMKIDLGGLILIGNADKDALKGRVNLPINLGSSSIQRIELSVERQGGGLPSGEGLIAVLSGSPKKIIHKGAGISPGIYTLTIKAYDASSGGNQIFLENPVQTITVFSGCETNTWYGIDGNPLPAGSNGLAIEQIDTSAANTFFVKGSGGVLPDGFAASDSNSGKLASPLASLNAALSKCMGTGSYIIYVDGTVTEPNPSAQTEVNKPVTIKSLSTRATIKKANGFTKSLIKIASGGSLTLENIVLDGADVDYAGGGGLVYNEGTLTLKNGTVLQNGKAQNGGAVYNKGAFNIGGSAKVALSAGNDENKPGKNDIYSESGKHITVTAALSPEGGKTGRITPATYTAGTQVLKAEGGVTLANEVVKFTVTPQDLSGGISAQWSITDEGKLKQTSAVITSSNSNAWKELKEAVAAIADGGTIIIDGEIKATNAAGNSGTIIIDKNLTIKGKTGKDSNSLNANSHHSGASPSDAPTNEHNIFDVRPDKSLTLEKITLKNGKTPAGDSGGGVYAAGKLIMKNSIITDCHSPSNAGGVFVSSTFEMHGASAITNCTAAGEGGAIYATGQVGTNAVVRIAGGQISGNTAHQGGGIFIANGGKLYINTDAAGNPDTASTPTIITNNHTDRTAINNYASGGALFCSNVELKMHNTTISNCGPKVTRAGAEAYGAGLTFVDGGTAVLTSVEISGCKFEEAGGSYAKKYAGAIFIGPGSSTVTLGDKTNSSLSCRIHGNEGGTSGGGIINNGTLTIYGGTIENNTADEGGGISADNGRLTIEGVNLTGNTATKNGAGIYANNNTSVTMTGCNLTGNQAITSTYGSGGAVYAKGATVTMENCNLKGNQAKENGGAVCAEKDGTTPADITIKGGTIGGEGTDGNEATNLYSFGGGIYVNDGCSLTLEHVQITGNKAGRAGGIRANRATVKITGCTITENRAEGSQGDSGGGGVYTNGGTLNMTGCTFTGNKAENNGGGMNIENTTVTIKDCTLTGNTAAKGGGMYMEDGTFTIKGSSTVTPSTGADANQPGKNDIYLKDGKKITVAGTLTPQGGTAGRITPASYTVGAQLLDGSAVSSEHTKFTVTPKNLGGGSTQNWMVDSTGKLRPLESTITGGTGAWAKLKEAVDAIADGGTITIEGEIKATGDTGNNGEIVINKNLTIKGKTGSSTDILNADKDVGGKPKHRIFKVEGKKNFTLKNLTLKNGHVRDLPGADKAGGAIYAKDCIAEMTNCIFTENTASTGGALFVAETSTVNINNCTFSKNTVSDRGGALFIGNIKQCTVTIIGGTIGGTSPADGNKVISQGPNQTGGGICVYSGTCTLKNVTIQHNSTATSGLGSGIWLHGSYDGSAKLIVEETVTIKDNNLMLGDYLTYAVFVTAHNLASSAYIDIRPQDYTKQKNTPLVKVSGTKPANWENCFSLVNIPSGQTWKLEKNSADNELILKEEP